MQIRDHLRHCWRCSLPWTAVWFRKISFMYSKFQSGCLTLSLSLSLSLHAPIGAVRLALNGWLRRCCLSDLSATSPLLSSVASTEERTAAANMVATIAAVANLKHHQTHKSKQHRHLKQHQRVTGATTRDKWLATSKLGRRSCSRAVLLGAGWLQILYLFNVHLSLSQEQSWGLTSQHRYIMVQAFVLQNQAMSTSNALDILGCNPSYSRDIF